VKIFIDGRAGTTGLQIEERLRKTGGVALLEIEESRRKDPSARAEMLNAADAAFLCLPDDAAREAAALVTNPKTVIFDASTAHRTHTDWAYGFPELSEGHCERVRSGNRIAVPGCHATGFSAIVYPLVQSGMISRGASISCFSLTGYSGGGKAMIEEYESPGGPKDARPYALTLTHKHLPEMQAVCGLEHPPIFMPVLAPVRQGMLVSVPLALDAGLVHRTLADWYTGKRLIEVKPLAPLDELENGRLDMESLNDTGKMELFVFGRKTQTVITARFDNLGKGASGAAAQCFKLRFNL
jgi:N-acetyl-gamma-glutamyl-phosphate reductase